MADLNVQGDSSYFISAEAWELVTYLYYSWKIYNKHEVKVKVYDRPVEKIEMPCLSCHSYSLCQEDGWTCSHMKQWMDKGTYDETHSTWK